MPVSQDAPTSSAPSQTTQSARAGAGHKPPSRTSGSRSVGADNPRVRPEVHTSQDVVLRDTKQVKRLEQFFSRWRGVRYRYGGDTSDGVDCSGLVMHLYSDLFDLKLPRTTAAQAKLGKRVRPNDLRAGDLVFFSLGARGRHVGVYLRDGSFIHASRSSRVKVSLLAGEYWQKHFWKAVRIVE